MSAELLQDLRSRGVVLDVVNRKLHYRGKLTADDLAMLKANKTAILAALSRQTPTEDAITQHHLPTVPVDALGYPFKPCTCGARHFWAADGKTWHCSDCCPDHALRVNTLTL